MQNLIITQQLNHNGFENSDFTDYPEKWYFLFLPGCGISKYPGEAYCLRKLIFRNDIRTFENIGFDNFKFIPNLIYLQSGKKFEKKTIKFFFKFY